MTERSDSLTRASLLFGVRDVRDDRAWQAFARRYEPLIRAACRKMGLGRADEDEVTQTVLIKLLAAMPKFRYDPAKGRFRDWIGRMARNKVIDFWRRQNAGRADRGSGATWVREALDGVQVPPGADLEEMARAIEEQGCRDEKFRLACDRVRRRVRSRTWDAFWLTTLERQKGAAVAKRLKMSVAAVYVAKDRVLKMIREEVQRLDGPQTGGAPEKGA